MVYRIVQYIQPWEIDDLDRQADQLIRGSYYLDAKVIVDVTMNLQVVDWEESNLPKSYFEDKFKYIETKLKEYYETNFDLDPTIQGCTDKRRQASKKEQDFIIWLDSDLYFPHQLLPLLILASKQIEDQDFILSPEIIKYWDHSWDCITNKAFLNEPHNHRDYFDLFSVDNFASQDETSIRKNNTIKFGGGWFNLIKSTMFNKVELVDELGAYAPDDTYLSYCGMKLGIPQYILTGVVVSEVGKRFLENKDYIKPLLKVKIQDKQKITDQQLNNLILEFYAKH